MRELNDQARAYWGGVLACRALRAFANGDITTCRAIYQEAVADDLAETLVTGLLTVAANGIDLSTLSATEDDYRVGTALAIGLIDLPETKEPNHG